VKRKKKPKEVHLTKEIEVKIEIGDKVLNQDIPKTKEFSITFTDLITKIMN
jgi:hypothetical protein